MSEFHNLIERYCPNEGRNVAVKYDGKKNTWQCLEKGSCRMEDCQTCGSEWEDDEESRQPGSII